MRKIIGLFLVLVGVGSFWGIVTVPKAASNALIFHYGFSLAATGIGMAVIFYPVIRRFFYCNRQDDYYWLIHYGIGWKEMRKRRYREWRWRQQQRRLLLE